MIQDKCYSSVAVFVTWCWGCHEANNCHITWPIKNGKDQFTPNFIMQLTVLNKLQLQKTTVTIVTGYKGNNPKLMRFYRKVCLPVVNISNVDNNYRDALLSDVQLPRQCAFVKMFTAASLFRLFWVIMQKYLNVFTLFLWLSDAFHC